MAQDYTYFEGYTTGVQPSDLTSRWVTTGETWAVQESADDIRGKHLQHDRTTTANRLLSWDTPSSGSDTDTELLVRWRSSSVAANQFAIIARASGAAGTETGYLFRNTSFTSVQISLLNAGTLSTIGAAVTIPAMATNTWFWMRFQVRGSDLKAKIWAGEHENEPAAWTIERTNSTIAGAGWFGVGNIAATGTRRYDAVAVGTAGDDAVFPVSPEARMTQAAMLVLDAPEADARMTQACALVLAFQPGGAEETRMTQAAMLALAQFEAGTRITQVAALVLADQVNCLTRWAQTWTITRTDGVVFGYTSHDMPVMFRGVLHSPCSSLAASAVEMSSLAGTVGNMDLDGIIADDAITTEDLYNGLFDGALVEVWVVPWDNAAGDIPFRLMGGTVGKTGQGLTGYTLEVLAEGTKLQQKSLVDVYTPGCRYNFGAQNDSRCPVDLGAITVSGSVTTAAIPNASNYASRRIFTDSSRAEADGFFNLGKLTWTGGANAGAVSEIKSFTGGTFVLWQEVLVDIAVGDTYDAHPGCDKSRAGHLLYNADMIDFGGFEDVPGDDSVFATPDAK